MHELLKHTLEMQGVYKKPSTIVEKNIHTYLFEGMNSQS